MKIRLVLNVKPKQLIIDLAKDPQGQALYDAYMAMNGRFEGESAAENAMVDWIFDRVASEAQIHVVKMVLHS